MKIIIDDKIPYIQGVLEPYAEVHYIAGAKVTADDVRDADAIITRTRTCCNAELLAGSSVKFIATATIGFDHIDTEYCALNNITWTNCPGCNSGSVNQYIASALLSLSVKHNIPLDESTIGIIGVGNVGKKIAHTAQAFGMKVLLNDPPRARAEGEHNFTDLDLLLKNSDFVTTHTPLNRDGEDKTFHLADTEFFNKMKSEAFYINTSRGEVSNNKDLKTALLNKSIAGAVLDVWEDEPHINLELMELLEYATPHIAGYSKDGKANGTSMSVRALAKFFDLPLQNWTPQNVPIPEISHITIASGSVIEKELIQAVGLSYDIALDSRHLRDAPSCFEQQRGDYPLRREFGSFTFDVDAKCNPQAATVLTNLGFIKK